MTTFVIFWSSLFFAIFFLIATVFKGLAALFDSIILSLFKTIKLLFKGGAVVAACFLLAVIVNGIITDGVESVLGSIAMFALVIGVIYVLFGRFGGFDLFGQIICFVLEIIIIIQKVLEGVSTFFEKLYCKALVSMFKRIQNV